MNFRKAINEKLIYWDFGTKRWIPCTVTSMLPSNIVVLQPDDVKIAPFKTCMDSYRLVYENAYNTTTKDILNDEREMRAKICEKNAKVDVLTNDGWIEGHVQELQDDIVKWVLKISAKTTISYLHFESSSVAAFRTYTKETDNVADEKISSEHLGHTELIKTMKIYPHDANNIDWKKDFGYEIDHPATQSVPPALMALMAAQHRKDPSYKLAWQTETRELTKWDTIVLINNGDLYTDLHVDGPKDATYTLRYDDQILGVIKGGETFEFDITNPLVNRISGQPYYISSTKPGCLTLKKYFMNHDERHMISNCNRREFLALRVPKLCMCVFLAPKGAKSYATPLESVPNTVRVAN